MHPRRRNIAITGLLMLLITPRQSAHCEYGSFYAGDNSNYSSPDGVYTILIKHEPLPQFRHNEYDNFFTLQLLKNHHVLSEFPTVGYLQRVDWSPNGRFVAINNRRDSCGDYCWVLDLKSGTALKRPDDGATKNIDWLNSITVLHPNLNWDLIYHYFIYTPKSPWIAPDQVAISFQATFFHGDHIYYVDDVFKASDSGLSKLSQTEREVKE